MKASAVYKKENGDRYEVEVSLTIDYSNRFYWQIKVSHCPKGKRKMIWLNCEDDWVYRNLNLKEREYYYKKFILSHVPAEWIIEVQQIIISILNKPII